ncbi:MAG: hypothetical protein WC876_02240 [Candidatus Thermoplasmatota archaeon]
MYQKPMMTQVGLETETASCSPCILITVTPPPVKASATVGDATVNVDTSGLVGGSVVVTSPTSGGCPTNPLPGLPTIGPVQGIQLPREIGSIIGGIDLPPIVPIGQ